MYKNYVYGKLLSVFVEKIDKRKINALNDRIGVDDFLNSKYAYLMVSNDLI